MPEEDRSHDTDPLADTQTSEDNPGASTRLSSQRRSVRAGDTLGRYELLEDVGEGGMATVYRARDKELRRDVAVKVLFPHLAKREEVVRRFHREARAAAGLEHANILRVYDVGGAESDDPPYIVMELIRGHSLLGEIERRGPLLAEVAACVGAVLADALVVAHQAGIIHRDIKPANVMIDGKGRVLLADFGVARLETEDSLVTKTGALLGTPAYMSPEQASGDTATAKSDLYSLGATLYQLATGHLPYSGSPAKVIAQIAQGALVPAARKRPAVGIDLSRLIDRMMAADPARRPASSSEVAAELRAIATASGFGDPADELAVYFADPDAFVARKLPGVVSALVAAGRQALADEKLPRAMALADRASALAPEDPAVAELVAAITEGGRASQRRRVLAMLGIGVVLAGGATFGAMQLLGERGATGAHDAALAMSGDALDDRGNPMLGDGGVGATIDPGHRDVDGGASANVTNPRANATDAGVARGRDAAIAIAARIDAGVATAPRRTDAGVATIALADAAIASSTPPADAAVQAVAVSVDAAAPATGAIVVKNDTWCEVTIDDVRREGARNTTKPIGVDAGKHTVICEQPGTKNKWTKRIEVAPGKTAIVEGTMLGLVEVRFDVDAMVNGEPYKRGQVARLRAARYDLVVGGTKAFVDVRQGCTVRGTPVVGCY